MKKISLRPYNSFGVDAYAKDFVRVESEKDIVEFLEKFFKGKKVGEKISKGDVLAWFGDYDENGGWEPHLHFQLSYREPQTHDLPGVVSEEDREKALKDFPDPRLVMGPIY